MFYEPVTVTAGQTLDISNTPHLIVNDNIIKIVYNEDASKSFILGVSGENSLNPELKWDICNNTQLTTDFALTQDGSYFQKISPNYTEDLYTGSSNGEFKLKVVSARDNSCSYLDIDISSGILELTRDFTNCAIFKFVTQDNLTTPSNNLSDVIKPYTYLFARKDSCATKNLLMARQCNFCRTRQILTYERAATYQVTSWR